jgi:uncharacterized protein YyaL (SSP411 family)
MLKNVLPEIANYPSGFSNWMDLLTHFQHPFYEIVVVGDNALKKVRELASHYLPNALLAGSNTQSEAPLFKNRYVANETLIYICVDNTCQLPLKDPIIAIKSLNKKE